MVTKTVTLEEVIADLVDLATEKYSPPEGSFSSSEYLKTLLKKNPDATQATARRQLDALVAAGKLTRTEDRYIIEDGGSLAYYYLPVRE